MPAERRIDPEDGGAYTYEEIAVFYSHKFKKKDIKEYWEHACWPAKDGGKRKPQAKAEIEVSEEDRGLVMHLRSESTMDLLKDSSPRRLSVGTAVDPGLLSFASKRVVEDAHALELADCGLGYSCRKGIKEHSPNQDSWMVVRADGNYSVYGVFDGHGPHGHDVSNFVKDSLPKLILKDPRLKTAEVPALLRSAFERAQVLVAAADRMGELDAKLSGTTASVAIHDHQSEQLFVGHVADSTIVLGTYKDKTKTDLEAVALTRDHKPNLKDERRRIERSGGEVTSDGHGTFRVYARNGAYPGLNMSRCLGDLWGHRDAGCIAAPEVSRRALDPSGRDHVLLVCSDGVWEVMEHLEAVQLVAAFPAAEAQAAADKLAKEAWDRWVAEDDGAYVDDITVVLVFL